MDGFELEGTWVPADGWEVTGGVGYLDAKIEQLDPIAGLATGVAVGNSLPYTPEWQANIAVAHDWDFSNGWGASARAGLSYQSETFFDANNTVEIAQTDPVTLVNLTFALDNPDGDLRLFAGINNATDEVYPIAGNSSLGTGSGYAEIAYDRGRTWYIGLETDF